MWEVCCHTDHMSSIAPTLKESNLEMIRDIGFFSLFIQSPYSLSLSFLKDSQLLGKQDALGQSKYSLNLDEALVSKFYQIIREDTQMISSSLEEEEGSEDEGIQMKALETIFL